MLFKNLAEKYVHTTSTIYREPTKKSTSTL